MFHPYDTRPSPTHLRPTSSIPQQSSTYRARNQQLTDKLVVATAPITSCSTIAFGKAAAAGSAVTGWRSSGVPEPPNIASQTNKAVHRTDLRFLLSYIHRWVDAS
jgi:hypothetical protein